MHMLGFNIPKIWHFIRIFCILIFKFILLFYPYLDMYVNQAIGCDM